MKFDLLHLGIFLLILALSFGVGFGVDAIATAVERNEHPLVEEYDAYVQQSAETFSVPEPILWATLKCKSGFASNAVGEGDRVGLMQLTPAEFHSIYTDYLETTPPEDGMRYDPRTSIYCGAAQLSRLFERYGVWSTVYAALAAGTDSVDAWLSDPACINEQGILHSIPDRDTARFVKEMEEAVRLYRELYYE